MLERMALALSVSKIKSRSPRRPTVGLSVAVALFAATLLLSVVTVPAAALAVTVTLGADDGPNVTLMLHQGDRIHLELAEQPGGGSVWQQMDPTTPHLETLGSTSRVGPLFEQGTRSFTWMAITTGQAELALTYGHPYERSVPPVKTYSMHVAILPGPLSGPLQTAAGHQGAAGFQRIRRAQPLRRLQRHPRRPQAIGWTHRRHLHAEADLPRCPRRQSHPRRNRALEIPARHLPRRERHPAATRKWRRCYAGELRMERRSSDSPGCPADPHHRAARLRHGLAQSEVVKPCACVGTRSAHGPVGRLHDSSF